jgi:DNA gyrase/topoisomerase IV subunit B
VDIHPEKKKPALEIVMTMLHAGGKFGGESYKVSGGLHGVGVSAVNALSEWCEVEVRREGKLYFQRYERGKPKAPVQVIGKSPAGQTGTKVTFLFDRQIFQGELDYRFETLAQRFREMAFVTRGVTISLSDERTGQETTFYFEGGILSFVRYLNRNREVLHPVVYANKEAEGIGVEMAVQYTDAYSESVYSFANTINTVDGGTHMTGLRAALTRTINDYARKAGLLKEADPNFAGDDTREGLTGIISIKHRDPQFESQTKVKLMNPEVQTLVQQVVSDAFGAFMEENPALGTGSGDSFDLTGLRYGRVIIMTDADVDGSHIRTLLLTFFFRYMQPLVEEGHLYIAQPPLYRVEPKGKGAGKERYVYSDSERDRAAKEFGGQEKVSVQRYKGLGEMNPQQLWDTTMDPQKRTLLQVSIDDAAEADRTFDMLMGSAVPPRKRFIQTHAKEVRNLDI